jgi:hypothetical protein
MNILNQRKSQLSETLHLISHVQRAVEHDNTTNNIKILGIEAGSQFIDALLAVIGVSISVVAGRLANKSL